MEAHGKKTQFLTTKESEFDNKRLSSKAINQTSDVKVRDITINKLHLGNRLIKNLTYSDADIYHTKSAVDTSPPNPQIRYSRSRSPWALDRTQNIDLREH